MYKYRTRRNKQFTACLGRPAPPFTRGLHPATGSEAGWGALGARLAPHRAGPAAGSVGVAATLCRAVSRGAGRGGALPSGADSASRGSRGTAALAPGGSLADRAAVGSSAAAEAWGPGDSAPKRRCRAAAEGPGPGVAPQAPGHRSCQRAPRPALRGAPLAKAGGWACQHLPGQRGGGGLRKFSSRAPEVPVPLATAAERP